MFDINIDIVGLHQDLTIYFDIDLYFPIAYLDEFNDILNKSLSKANDISMHNKLSYELQYFFTKLYDKGSLTNSRKLFDLDEKLVHIEKSDYRKNKIDQENYNQELLTRMRKREDWIK